MDGDTKKEEAEGSSSRDFSFTISHAEWEVMARTAGVSREGKWLRAGRSWRDVVLGKLEEQIPECRWGLRLGAHLLFRDPSVKSWESGSFAHTKLRCVRPAGEEEGGEEICGVSVSVRINERPEPDKDVTFVVKVLGPDPKTRHPFSGALSKTSFRRNMTGARKVAILKKVDQYAGTLAEFAKDMSNAAADQGVIETGNLTSVPTLNALRLARAKAKASGAFSGIPDEVDKWNSALVAEDEERGLPASAAVGWVQEHWLRPWGVTLLSEDSLLLIRQSLMAPNLRCYADATGNVCKNIPGEKKPVFLYSVLYESSDTSLNCASPIHHALSTSHDAERIRAILRKPFGMLERRVAGDWLGKPAVFISDHSAAMIRAAQSAYNGIRPWEYLRLVYRIITQGGSSEEIQGLTWTYVCAYHSLCAFPLGTARSKADSRRNTRLRRALGALLVVESLPRLKVVLGLLGTILCAEYSSEAVEEAEADLRRIWEAEPVLVDKLSALAEVEGAEAEHLGGPEGEEGETFLSRLAGFTEPLEVCSLEASRDGSTQTQRSPFYQELRPSLLRGRRRAEEADEEAVETGNSQRNTLHHAALFDNLLSSFLAHAPLLTQIARHPMRYSTGEDREEPLPGVIEPLYNNRAERWFGLCKQREALRSSKPSLLQEPQKRLSPQDLIANLRDTHIRDIKDLETSDKTGVGKGLHRIATTKRRRAEKAAEAAEAAEEPAGAVEEAWAKSPAKRPKQPRFLATPNPSPLKTIAPSQRAQPLRKVKEADPPLPKDEEEVQVVQKSLSHCDLWEEEEEGEDQPVAPAAAAAAKSDFALALEAEAAAGFGVLEGEQASAEVFEEEEVPRCGRLRPWDSDETRRMETMRRNFRPVRELNTPPFRPPSNAKRLSVPQPNYKVGTCPKVDPATRICPLPWGDHPPFPSSSSTSRPNHRNTCSGDFTVSLLVAVEAESGGALSRSLSPVPGREGVSASLAAMARAIAKDDGTSLCHHLDLLRSWLGFFLGGPINRQGTGQDLTASDRQAVVSLFGNCLGIKLAIACPTGDFVGNEHQPVPTLRCGQVGGLAEQLDQLLLHSPTQTRDVCKNCGCALGSIDTYTVGVDSILVFEIQAKQSLEACMEALEGLPLELKLPGWQGQLRGVSFSSNPIGGGIGHFQTLIPRMGSTDKRRLWSLYDGLRKPSEQIQDIPDPTAFLRDLRRTKMVAPSLAHYVEDF